MSASKSGRSAKARYERVLLGAFMSVVALVCVPAVLLYQGWTYYVFRHRVGGAPEQS